MSNYVKMYIMLKYKFNNIMVNIRVEKYISSINSYINEIVSSQTPF